MRSFKEGDRIELLAMPDDFDQVPIGTKGTVLMDSTRIDLGLIGHREWWQTHVRWDNGCTLSLASPPDEARKI